MSAAYARALARVRACASRRMGDVAPGGADDALAQSILAPSPTAIRRSSFAPIESDRPAPTVAFSSHYMKRRNHAELYAFCVQNA